MIEICTGGLIFILVIGGLGLPLCATLPDQADERVCLGVIAGCLLTYLFAWIVYWADFSPSVFIALPISAFLLIWLRWREVGSIFRVPAARRLMGLWLLVGGWCLGWLALIRNYSGGEWSGDWVEHYRRALFFLEHQPLSTHFLVVYAVPARPPLANLVVGALMALSRSSFAYSQVYLALFSSVVFFPAALLARQFRAGSGDPAPMAAILLMLSPFFVENATFNWTKLPAAFFVLAGLYFFLRARPFPANRNLVYAFVALAAAVLTHYSAAPYVVVIVLAWIIMQRSQWKTSGFQSVTLQAIAAAVVLGATWFIWSAHNYGSATFLSNTAVTDNAGLGVSQQIARRFMNFFQMVVPHPLRPAQYEFIAQSSQLSWWRDYFFNLYQTNLLFAFGSAGMVIVGYLIWMKRTEIGGFWTWFVAASLILNSAVISWPDRWGAVHIGLQPMVVLGLAWISAHRATLGRRLHLFLVAGLSLDFALGILLQYAVEHLDFPPSVLVRSQGAILSETFGETFWRNFASKQVEGVSFVGDGYVPVFLVGTLLSLFLALALRMASVSDPKASPSV